MGADRCLQLCNDLRTPGIGDVDDGCADAALAHMADIRKAVSDVDMHAVAVAIEVGLADQAHIQGLSHVEVEGIAHSLRSLHPRGRNRPVFGETEMFAQTCSDRRTSSRRTL